MLADKIFRNGVIVTVDPHQPWAEAIAVRDSHILAVGSWESLSPLQGSSTEIIDLKGNTLLPGFVEAHAHPLMSGIAWGDPVIDIRAVHTPTYDAAIAKMKRRAAKAKPGEILWFLGLDPQLHIGMREPSVQELDDISTTNPIVVQTSNTHAGYLNTAALAAFGIDDNYVPPMGGQVQRDETGALWKFEELAIWAISLQFFDTCDDTRNKKVMTEWLNMFARAGYTTSSEIFVAPHQTPYFERVLRGQEQPIRVFGYEHEAPDLKMSVSPDNGDDLWNIRGLKIQADGSVLVGNVWVSKPYLNTKMTRTNMGLPEDNVGHMNYTRDELLRMMSSYAVDGWQIAVHAHGDLTIDAVLNVFEEVLATHPQAAKPFRLEHCGIMRSDQIERAVKLGVSCSYFLPYIYYWGDALHDNLLGPQRAARFAPSGEALRKGMRVSHHCDSPMTWPNALLCLYLATTRKSSSGRVLGPDQRMTIDEAICAITLDAAYQLRMEDKIGSLAAGKYADFVILDGNILTREPDDLLNAKILGTYLGGRSVWSEL
ncbi:amidohydrolase [Mesorhizobium sp.]|uniref:amidohydrolase n=1 Tax=Mesorhizobium sp. TaxID=1871066 RepID=UPI000FE64C3F|nr:amidohydrolase [Mesorhizobium sp.]RWO82085.1 MAG: amidohydrolase [Mesorhizobium sp.]